MIEKNNYNFALNEEFDYLDELQEELNALKPQILEEDMKIDSVYSDGIDHAPKIKND